MDLKKVQKILVRGPNWIGDAVMCTPALAALRSGFPDADVTLWVNPTIAELLRENPHVDRVFVYDKATIHQGFSGKMKLVRELEKESFDLAVLFQNAFEAAFLTRLARIPIRCGYPTDGRGFLLTISAPLPKGRCHQVDYYLHLLRALGVAESSRIPILQTTQLEEDAIRQRLREYGIASGDRVVAINPGATYGSAKRWSTGRYAELADRLIESHQAKVLILGGPGEEVIGREITAQMRHEAVMWSGRLAVRELMAVIRQADLLITNDSGPMHIAAAFGVPLVAIFGPTDPEVTSPVGENCVLLRHPVECSPCLLRECPIDHRCMVQITVDQAFEAADMQLKAQSAKRKGQERELSFSFQLSALSNIAVFLDRDGTINEDTGYLDSPAGLKLLPGAAEAIRRINENHLKAIVLTNQSGVARGYYTEDRLKQTHQRLEELLHEQGARLDGIYYCIHHPDEGCQCRKPGLGLVERVCGQIPIDLSRSYVIGDKATDIQLAYNIGAKGILVLTGWGKDQISRLDPVQPAFIASDLFEAVEWIVQDIRRINSGTTPCRTSSGS